MTPTEEHKALAAKLADANVTDCDDCYFTDGSCRCIARIADALAAAEARGAEAQRERDAKIVEACTIEPNLTELITTAIARTIREQKP